MATVPYSILVDYVDIGAVINDLNIKIANKSGQELKCYCVMPDHEDSTPSMSINMKTGMYHCFGCRAKGNLLTLVTIIKGLEFPDNKYYLEQFSDIHSMSQGDVINDICRNREVETNQSDIIINGFSRSYTYIEEVNLKPVYYPLSTDFWSAEVYEWCEKSLIDFNAVKSYFNVGYCRVGKYGKRVIIPIWFQKKLINFQARDPVGELEQKDLYIYGIPVNNILFNYDNVNWDYPVIIVEGAVDVLRLWPYSTNCVGTLGSFLSDNQAVLLQKAKLLITMPDNDQGGRTLLKSIKEKMIGKELWLRYFDKKDIPNLLKKVVKVNG